MGFTQAGGEAQGQAQIFRFSQRQNQRTAITPSYASALFSKVSRCVQPPQNILKCRMAWRSLGRTTTDVLPDGKQCSMYRCFRLSKERRFHRRGPVTSKTLSQSAKPYEIVSRGRNGSQESAVSWRHMRRAQGGTYGFKCHSYHSIEGGVSLGGGCGCMVDKGFSWRGRFPERD